MSNFFLADRIKETSRFTGTNSISLDGAVDGFSSFGDFYASGDLVFYAVTDNTKYEVGSGIYEKDGSTRVITRNPFRSSNINVGPWYVNATSNSGPTDGTNGYFYPLWLSKSAATSGIGFSDGPYTAISGISFDEYPGITFYHATEHSALGVTALASSGSNYSASGQPVNFSAGLKEVFVTYPGKTSVYNGYGIDPDIKEPKHSGVAFWKNEQIINYDSEFVWDDTNGFLGINQPAPQYAIDVGGLVADSIIRASGFVDGGSGIAFSGGQLTDTLLTASGGTQLEPFLRNRKGTAANGVIELSGVVDQIIDFVNQPPATVFAGPASGWCGTPPCADDAPTFRQLVADDLPLEELEGLYVIQNNVALDSSQNTSATPFIGGMVALYSSSGQITFDSGVFYDASNNRLAVGKNASVDSAIYTLDIGGEGTLSAASGYFNQLLFTDDIIRIGDFAGEYASSTNSYLISIGDRAGLNSSGIQVGVLVGSGAGRLTKNAEDVILIGSSAGSGLTYGNAITAIGQSVAKGGSGIYSVVVIGSGAGVGASQLYDSFVAGGFAGSGLKDASGVVGIGLNSLYNASGVDDVVAIGKNVLNGSTVVVDSSLIGKSAASGSFELTEVVAIGDMVAAESSGVSRATLLGQAAGRYAETLDSVIAIGQFAAQSGLELERTVALGALAGSQASGSFNTYIGQDAGIAVSGHENIEIVASGTNESFLGTESSGKMNIGSTIVADMYRGRVKVGSPADASPDATLEVRPYDSEEVGFLVRHLGSGGAESYLALQSGDATTFFSVNNSGDLVTSGCLNPSGGILLEQITPSDWINDTSNRLYNDAGTLKWNGTALAVGGGFTSFNLTNGAVAADAITDGQTVTISGVSGVEAQYDAASNFFRISASGLSGVLQEQIVAQTYTFDAVASGYGSNNNDPKTMDGGSVLAVSGVSGVNIDFLSETDGTNSSGIFILGYDPDVTYSFNAVASGNGADNNNPKTMPTDSVLAISGVSGVTIDFENLSDGTNESGVFILGWSSGVLADYWSKASGEYNYSQILENTTSGVSISGIAEWASGEFARAGLSAVEGESGIIKQDGHYILDISGTGNLSRLNLLDTKVSNLGSVLLTDSGNPGRTTGNFSRPAYNVHIGANAGSGINWQTNSVFIGSGAGIETWGLHEPFGHHVFIGTYAGYQCSGDSNWSNIAIGDTAGSGYHGRDGIAIGTAAGSSSHCDYSVAIGSQALALARTGGTIAIGLRAASGINTWYLGRHENIIAIGQESVAETTESQDIHAIGKYSGSGSTLVERCEFFGVSTGGNTSKLYDTVAIGTKAGWKASHLSQSILIGHEAGYLASGAYITPATGLIAIGREAGANTVECDDSVFIGEGAGYGLTNYKSCIAIGKTSYLSWASSNTGVISLNQGIIGFSGPEDDSLFIGNSIADVGSVGSPYDDNSVASSTLTLMNTTNTKTALKINLHPEDGSSYLDSDQAQSLVRCQWRPYGAGATTIHTYDNEIINKFGALTLPVARSKTGSGTSTQLYDGAGQEIPRFTGTVCIFNETSTGDDALAICINNVWQRIDANAFF